MRVKLLQSLSGPEMNYNQGDEADFDNEEAARLIDANIAIPIAPEPVKETRKKAS